ncbi:hypothetical protein [Roseiterribacter gracilis]|uniref:Uncharacterized protein n=1 Tax=Roseiterribacter gracilis TaxID=2812848 RepID=A0A8S8X7A8_9PROT|nr:hypothetical protein TMPK1_16950 [Rhodospirillales bacterium TMPK1]
MSEERIVDFEAALRARRTQPQPSSRPVWIAVALIVLSLASILFGLDGRLVSTVARLVTSTQCALETHADRFFPSPSGQRHVLPRELEPVR